MPHSTIRAFRGTMICNPLIYFFLQTLCVVFSTGGRATWKMAIEYLKNSRDIVVFNATDLDIDTLFSIKGHGDHTFLINTRGLADIKKTLHLNMTKEIPKEIEAEPIGYVCLVNDAADARAILTELGEHSPRAKTVIYTEKKITNFKQILRHAWDAYNMMNIVVIEGDRDITSFSVFNPFENVGGGVWGLVHTFVANDKNASAVLEIADKLMGNRLMDMHDYPLKVTFIEGIVVAERVHSKNGTVIGYTGMDVFLQSCLAERMKYRSILTRPRDNERYGGKDESGHWRGILGDIEYKYTVLSANMRPVLDYGTHHTAFSKPIKQTRLCYLAPKYYPPAPTIPLKPSFDNLANIAMIATLFTCAILWYLLRKYYYKQNRPGFWKTLADTLRLAISAQTQHPSNIPEQIIFLVLSFLSLLLVHIYSGQIITRVTSPGLSMDIQSLQELDESGLEIGIIDSLQNLNAKQPSEHSTQTAHDRLLRRVIVVRDVDDAKDGAVAGRLATLLPESIAQSLVNNVYSKDNGMDLLHIVGECPLPLYSAYIVPKTSPYIDRFDEIILRLQSCGVMGKWEQDSIFRIEMARIRRTYKYVVTGLKKFSIHYYWKVFIAYGIGVGMSFLVLIAELLYRKLFDNVPVRSNGIVSEGYILA